ncbi:Prefoldin subunit 4 [Rhodofomes roseus]|uniref:Prefoldin subunit 4 n=1 Tax=Rhodofomes roseus TaxID=34475 RepID=A0ABQ8KLE2_9APHY|nr:Prefoldin subunit 4 [Rhodofomes roseus]KAH9839147.1 Prefoldin subunit 4 [Rhodofomes roseus]
MRMLPQEDENNDNVEVTWEDQQRINTFSKMNTRLRGIEAQMEELKQDKEALDDLAMELELSDEDQPVLYVSEHCRCLFNLMIHCLSRYKVGEAFLHLPHRRAMKQLERDQAQVDKQFSTLTNRAEECEKTMKELKVVLYAKFGRAINLDE